MNIKITGAKENNLKNVNLEIPKNKLIVFTGVSGSGKSTMAMETLQRECQRQYMESLGMTMEMGTRPMVDSIEGLSPAISIHQRNSNRNPRSTVGTITEIASYLRILFSKLGKSDKPDWNQQEDELTPSFFSFNKPEGACETCKGLGVVNTPDLSVIIDESKSITEFAISGWDQVYVDRYGTSIEKAAKYYGFDIDITAKISTYHQIQKDLLLYGVLSEEFSRHFPDTKPPKTVLDGRFEGVVTNLMRRYEEKSSESAKQRFEKFIIQKNCPSCNGIRLKKEVLDVKVKGKNIMDVLGMSMTEVNIWLKDVVSGLSTQDKEMTDQLTKSLMERTERIIDVGAQYLTLNQPAVSLSAGESQRIKLASVLGSNLTGVLYILDEPTSGLHAGDTEKVVNVLNQLKEKGNTVIVIEHNLDLIRRADYVVDFGPGAGREGGQVIGTGMVADIINIKDSVTGSYLAGIPELIRQKKTQPANQNIQIKNADKNNLKNIDVTIPLERFVTVTGVSGAGKSSLIFGELAETAEEYFHSSDKNAPEKISGLEHFDDVVTINQASIGRASRSNTATYTDLFTDIRNLYAKIAKEQNINLQAKHFSYNVAGGRCEECQGAGKLSIPMHFLPDVEVTCPVCKGKRYQKPVLSVTYHGYHISNTLDLSVDEAIIVFKEQKQILTKLKTLQEVGLGYLILGQSTATLSGGEAQRLKLAKELLKQVGGKVLYLFDEPTCGLHQQDCDRLVGVFDKLVEKGNSVIVIDHNLELIKASDWVIDLGPEGGNGGGTIVAQGMPGDIMRQNDTKTGRALANKG